MGYKKISLKKKKDAKRKSRKRKLFFKKIRREFYKEPLKEFDILKDEDKKDMVFVV